MTVVAWDGKTLAADRRCTRGGTIYSTLKIHRVGDMLVGMSGGTDYCAALLAWFKNGAKPEDWPETQKDPDYACALVIVDGMAFTYDRTPVPVPMLEPICAIGSGREVALGAMTAGATAAESVHIATRWMSDCGNGVDTLTLEA